MIFLTVKDIIKAQKLCFLMDQSSSGYCKDCPLLNMSYEESNCQEALANATIAKLNELVELLDDKVNHHYYDTLEALQEQNTQLRDRLDEIRTLVDKHMEYIGR